MTDAGFEDGAGQPLRLRAESTQDLAVISALAQDAVGRGDRIAWTPRTSRFTLLLNRFRWEDAEAAERQRRPRERVQCLLAVDAVLHARSLGFDPADRTRVLSLLSLAHEAGTGEDPGRLRILLAGGAEIALEVELLDVTLQDVTRPYEAVSQRTPRHGDD